MEKRYVMIIILAVVALSIYSYSVESKYEKTLFSTDEFFTNTEKCEYDSDTVECFEICRESWDCGEEPNCAECQSEESCAQFHNCEQYNCKTIEECKKSCGDKNSAYQKCVNDAGLIVSKSEAQECAKIKKSCEDGCPNQVDICQDQITNCEAAVSLCEDGIEECQNTQVSCINAWIDCTVSQNLCEMECVVDPCSELSSTAGRL